MKKLSLALFLLAGTAAFSGCSHSGSDTSAVADTVAATDLHHYFEELAKLPHMGPESTPDTIGISKTLAMDNIERATATNLGRDATFETGNAIFGILDHVGLDRMINGGNNGSVATFVYASPVAGSDRYEMLMVTADGAAGNFWAFYGTTDSETVNTIQAAPLAMQGSSLTLTLSQNADSTVYLVNISNL